MTPSDDKRPPVVVALVEAARAQDESSEAHRAAERPVSPTASDTATEEDPIWFEFSVRDEEGYPVVDEAYEITLPGGQVIQGVTDQQGSVVVEYTGPVGEAQLSFPCLHKTAWTLSGG